MPYKDKKDRTEAVRRYRGKKKEKEEAIEANKLFQETLTKILTEHLGFNTIPFRDLVEIMQTDYVLKKDGVFSRKAGRIIDDIEIFFGLNMMIAVETLHMTMPQVNGK